MAGFTDTSEALLLNWFFAKGTTTQPSAWHVGLFTTTPTDDAGTGGVEVSGGAYARVSVSTGSWTTASGTAPVTISNSGIISFPTPTASWGTAAGFGIWSASTSGTLYLFAPLSTSKTIGIGDPASFAVGALKVQIGDVGDSFG